MLNHSLHSISPIDGRYAKKTESLSGYFSEFALIKYRVWVELEYFIALCEIPLPQLQGFDKSKFTILREIYKSFGESDALRVKEIEKVTNHDVKAVEYFLRERFDAYGLESYKEFIHFGLTSQDVNNTAFLQCSAIPLRLNISHCLKVIGKPKEPECPVGRYSHASPYSWSTSIANSIGQRVSGFVNASRFLRAAQAHTILSKIWGSNWKFQCTYCSLSKY